MARMHVLLLTPVILVSGVLGAACSSDGGAASTAEFCDELRSAAEDSPDQAADDAEAVRESAEQFNRLAETAPEEIRGSFVVFADAIDQLAALEGTGSEDDIEDIEDFGAVMELMFDPEFLAATTELTEYAVDECGFDPEEAGTTFGGDGGATFEDDEGFEDPGSSDDPDEDILSGGEISLEDLDVVKADPANADWAELIISSTVWGESQIGVHGVGPDDEFIDSPPLTESQAMAACEALIEAFGADHPQLEVTTGNGDTDLVSGTVEDGCSPL